MQSHGQSLLSYTLLRRLCHTARYGKHDVIHKTGST